MRNFEEWFDMVDKKEVCVILPLESHSDFTIFIWKILER